MKSDQYLKPELYYIDLYDKFTVEECRNIERRFNAKAKLPNKQGLNEKGVRAAADVAIIIFTHCCTGERALKKDETIREWMEGDRIKDERLENAVVPQDIFCRTCGEEMECRIKQLHDRHRGQDRVLFLFRCKNCKVGRGVFEGGQEWEPKKEVCPKCHSVLSEKDTRKGKKITTTYTCLNCEYTKQDVFDTSVKKEKPDPNFERDRAKFCLTKEQAQRYFEQRENLKSLSEHFKELEAKKANKPLYDAVEALEKLSVDQLEVLVNKSTKEAGYAKLEFRQPEIDKYVVISFTIRDGKKDRDGRSSELALRRLLRTTLENTNWRLMNDGVMYRLGVLSGKLKGYEREEDLVRLVEQRSKKNAVQRYKKDGSFAAEGEEGYIL